GARICLLLRGWRGGAGSRGGHPSCPATARGGPATAPQRLRLPHVLGVQRVRAAVTASRFVGAGGSPDGGGGRQGAGPPVASLRAARAGPGPGRVEPDELRLSARG